MRIALISDIHANREALEAVLQDMEERHVDKIHCLGDVIGYGCDPVACLELVDKNCDLKLMGNHEYAAIGVVPLENMNRFARESIVWTRNQLGDREISMIADYDLSREAEDGLLVHASPFEPDEWHYIFTEREAVLGFESFQLRLAFHGHTHVPIIFCQTPAGRLRTIVGHDFDPDEDCRYLINVGSVGQPRDDDPRACYVVYDSKENAIDYHRVEYDFRATQAKMSKAEMPKMLIERLEVGR